MIKFFVKIPKASTLLRRKGGENDTVRRVWRPDINSQQLLETTVRNGN